MSEETKESKPRTASAFNLMLHVTNQRKFYGPLCAIRRLWLDAESRDGRGHGHKADELRGEATVQLHSLAKQAADDYSRRFEVRVQYASRLKVVEELLADFARNVDEYREWVSERSYAQWMEWHHEQYGYGDIVVKLEFTCNDMPKVRSLLHNLLGNVLAEVTSSAGLPSAIKFTIDGIEQTNEAIRQ